MLCNRQRVRNILKADGFDEALIGIGRRCSQEDILVYDFNKAVKILMDRDKMTEEEAMEYLEFNTVGAWVGEETPVFVYPMTMEEIDEMQQMRVRSTNYLCSWARTMLTMPLRCRGLLSGDHGPRNL